MKTSGGNQSEAARLLQTTRTTLIDKMKRLGHSLKPFRHILHALLDLTAEFAELAEGSLTNPLRPLRPLR